MTEHSITSGRLSAPRKLRAQRASAPAADCLVFLDGELYIDRVKAPEIVQEAQESGQLPAVDCLYVCNPSAADRHVDYTCSENYAAFVAEDIRPWIAQNMGGYERLFLCGLSLSGLQALFTALRHPVLFRGVLAQSPSAWWNDEWLASSPPHTDREMRLPFWISVGTRELQENVTHPPSGMVQKSNQLDSVRRLVVRMRSQDHDIHAAEFDGGHDPTCWGAELTQALAWLMNR